MWVLYGPAKVPFSPFSSLVKLEGRRALARGGGGAHESGNVYKPELAESGKKKTADAGR